MKRFISILIVLLCCINISSVCVTASGGEAVTINPVSFDAENNSLVVSGVVNDTRDRIPMTLHISNGGDTIAAGETLAVGFNESGVPYAFEPVYLGYDTPSGDFTITVTAGFIGESASLPYTYKGVDKQHEALTKLNASIKAEDDTQYISDLYTYSDALGIDIDSFDALGDTAEAVAVGSLMAHEYTLPDDYDTSEECLLVQAAVRAFTAHFKEAMVLGDFFNASSISGLKSWYLANEKEYSLTLDDKDTASDESKMVSYFEGILESENYLARRSYMTSVLTVKELYPVMMHQAILQTVEESGQYAVKKIVGDFPDLLIYLDYSAWNSLDDEDDRKTSACISVAGKPYADVQEFCDAVDAAIALVLAGDDDDDGKKDSYVSKGRGGSVSVSSDAIQPAVKPVAQFTDIETTHWAWNAVRYLYGEGIVSGKTADNFAPNDYVTRAELAKLVALAYKLSSSGDAHFGDVNASAWYASYVLAAAEHGIVLGDGKGNFNPQGLVTRQDAAVMLHRADGSPNSMAKANFKDYSDISSYAKPAVDYMYANGIINGVGDGIFAPKANLTRAAVAKMLYLILTQ